MFMEVEPAKLRALLKAEPNLFPYVPYDSLKGSNEEDSIARESTTAAYGMGTIRLGRTTIVGGVRAEHNTWDSKRKDVDARTLSIKPREAGRTYTEVLPGLHLRHQLQENLILRESYNRSYARPGLSRLTLGRSEDINGNIAVGNPLLNPTQSHNVDVQIEKYTAKGGLYSAGFFWKKMKGFYYNADLRFTDVDANGDPIVDPLGTRRYRKQENADGATNYGIELIVQQKMHFLPPLFRGLTANLSATFGKSDAEYGALRRGEHLPTFGFSDTMFNASLDYALGKFRTNIRYSYRSDYLTGIGDNKYTDDTFAAREQVDWEGSYRLTRKVRLTANVINLTSRPQVSYQSFPQYVEDNSNSGWRATFGVDVTF